MQKPGPALRILGIDLNLPHLGARLGQKFRCQPGQFVGWHQSPRTELDHRQPPGRNQFVEQSPSDPDLPAGLRDLIQQRLRFHSNSPWVQRTLAVTRECGGGRHREILDLARDRGQ